MVCVLKKVAKFEKVSLEQFRRDFMSCFPECCAIESIDEHIKEIYNSIILPKRATKGSAGYDFFSPISFKLRPGETIKLPTGIRCYMEEGWVLKIYPRSGLGFKFRLQLNNTVGIIDSDYYGANNEGHIMARLTNDTNEEKIVVINKDSGFMQGIFVEYGICYDDEAEGIREGGFGSTNK